MGKNLSPQFVTCHDRGALLADRDGGGGVRHSQRRLPIGPCRQRHRKRRGDGIARARDVAHLDRMGRHMDGLAVARYQGHAVLALRHQHGRAVRKLHRVLGYFRNARFGIGAAAGRFREFLAVGREQRRTAINCKIGALGIDDNALTEFSRGVDDVADHACRQHAFGVVGQQDDIGTVELRQDGVDQFLLDIGRSRRGQFPVRAQHVRRKMLGDKTHFSRRRPRGIAHQHALDSAFLQERLFQFCARIILADQPDKNAAGAERRNIARDVAGAADIGLAALSGDDRRGRLRRNPRHLAIDEFVEHEVADAEYRLADNRLRKSVKIEHLFSSVVARQRKRSARSRKPLT